MAKNKMPQAKFTTEIGTLVWPHLHAPDTYKGDEKYKTDITLSAKDAAPLLKTAKKLIKQAIKQGLASDDPVLPGEKNDDGSHTFKTKRAAHLGAPALFDSSGTPLEEGLKVGGGTKARVAGLMRVYEGFGNTGVTMYLNGVQIIDLKTFGGGDASSFGFDATEGFTADDVGEDEDDMFSNDSGDLEEDADEDDMFADADF